MPDWDLWETVGTAAGSLTLIWLESVALRHGLLAPLGSFLARHHRHELGIDLRELEPKKLIHPLFLSAVDGDGSWATWQSTTNSCERNSNALISLVSYRTARCPHSLGSAMRLHVLSTDVDAKSLLPHLIERTQRFERETGIRARFVSDSSVVDLKRSICAVVARIVHEALTNVRKHSCATDVWVRLDRKDGHWQLTIEDNGSGFPYSGRFSQSELKVSGKGPLVILECATSIGGDLTLESTAGRGSRLEITIPAKRELLEKIKHFGLGSPDDDFADEAGIAVKKPKSPNLNSGSAAASLDELSG